jgi:hypothetical protein
MRREHLNTTELLEVIGPRRTAIRDVPDPGVTKQQPSVLDGELCARSKHQTAEPREVFRAHVPNADCARTVDVPTHLSEPRLVGLFETKPVLEPIGRARVIAEVSIGPSIGMPRTTRIGHPAACDSGGINARTFPLRERDRMLHLARRSAAVVEARDALGMLELRAVLRSLWHGGTARASPPATGVRTSHSRV